MAMNNFQASTFRSQLQTSLNQVKLILDTEKSRGLSLADGVDHTYEDKYLLSIQLTVCSGIAVWNSLAALGLSVDKLQQLKEWASVNSVSLRFATESRCRFIKEATRKEDSKSVEVEYSSGLLSSKMTSKVVTTITEYFYEYESTYRIEAFRGQGLLASDKLEVAKRTSTQTCIVRSKEFPFAESSENHLDVEIGWFLRYLVVAPNPKKDADSLGNPIIQFEFQIDRANKLCRTPTRNPETQEILAHWRALQNWCTQTVPHFTRTLHQIAEGYAVEGARGRLDMSQVLSQEIFVPVMPIFRDSGDLVGVSPVATAAIADSTDAAAAEEVVETARAVAEVDATAVDVVLTNQTLSALLTGQSRSLQQSLRSLDSTFPAPTETANTLLSSQEARTVVILLHISEIVRQYEACITYLEEMLRNQLIAALGREVTPTDFARYMQFHYTKLFRPAFCPRPLSVAVRRSSLHSPEGLVRLECAASFSEPNKYEPIETFCRSWLPGAVAEDQQVAEMSFAINAATRVRFRGSRHVHGYLAHSFAAKTGSSRHDTPPLRLVATARQFSCFLVVLGRISSATDFDAQHAFLVENKEDIEIPLLSETIPSAQAFRDAISSLSPAQQRFAQAYRSMQLQSTIFGVLVIQIKPQLETLLRLTPDSLTKEIQLTQDLVRVFVDFQVPSDLVSVDAEVARTASAEQRLREVRGHVKKILDLVSDMKQNEVREARTARDYAGQSHHSQPVSLGMQATFSAPSSEMVHALARRNVFRVASSGPAAGGAAVSSLSVPPPPPAAPGSSSSDPFSTLFGSSNIASATSTTSTKASPQQQQQQQQLAEYTTDSVSTSEVVGEDFTRYPRLLDSAFDSLDPEQHAVRPTILNTGPVWTRRRPRSLALGNSASNQQHEQLRAEDQGRLRTAAFDLLDALTRSGALVIDDAELHIVLVATHNFADLLLHTVVQRNENPIEDAERSAVILASQLHGNQASLASLVLPSALPRLLQTSPQVVHAMTPALARTSPSDQLV